MRSTCFPPAAAGLTISTKRINKIRIIHSHFGRETPLKKTTIKKQQPQKRATNRIKSQMPPKKSTTAAGTKAEAEKPKPKGKAAKRAREEDESTATKTNIDEDVPTTNQNTELISGLEALAFYEFKSGDKYAALAHLKCAGILQKRFMKKLTAAKDIPYNFGEAAGSDRNEYIGRGHRHLIDEFLNEDKKTFDRLEELKAENTAVTFSGSVDEGLRAEIMATEVNGVPPSAAVLKKIAEEVTKHQSSTIDNLKTLLRANRQPVTGVKAELLRRISEGIVMGALPACPQCYGGKLKYDVETGVYSCHGYMDDDTYKFCYYRAADAERNPWQ